MRATTRWILFEGMKLAFVLALFTYIHHQVIDSKYEVYASTDRLVDQQATQSVRLLDLERESGDVIAQTEKAVHHVRADLESQSQELLDQRRRLALERAALSHMIDSKAQELRSILETSLDRVEGANVEQSKAVTARVSTLESAIRRSPQDMKRRMIYPIVQLRGNGTVGSGVVISSEEADGEEKAVTYILTAYHVVQEITEGLADPTKLDELRFMDPQQDDLAESAVTARVVAIHPEIDIALVRTELDDPWPFVARLADPSETRDVEIFDQVYAVGCPLGNKPLPTVGEISSQEKMVAGQNFWMVNAPTFFGNSGGGIFKRSNGHLVGISSMIYTYGKSQPMVVPHMGLFVPLSTVSAWLGDEGYAFLFTGDAKVKTASAETHPEQR